MDTTKRCFKCGDAKPQNAFYRCASKTDGLQDACKACCDQYGRDNYAAKAPLRAEANLRHEAEREAQRVALRARTEKMCPRCNTIKSVSDFFKCAARAHLDGLQSDCKACQTSRTRGYVRTPAGKRAQSKQKRMSKYRLDDTSFANMLTAQKNLCAICERLLVAGRGTHVDHDHACCSGSKTCGKCVRGLLCDGCNHMIGKAHDDVSLLRAAANYLEKYKALPPSALEPVAKSPLGVVVREMCN